MKIAIWGAGKFGQYVMEQLLANDSVELQCIIDNYADSCQKINNIEIVSPNVFLKRYDSETDCVLVAFTEGLSILQQLKDMGIKSYGFIHKRVFHYKMKLGIDILQDCNILWNHEREL